MEKIKSNILQWIPIYGRASVERPAGTYIHELCADIGCTLEELRGAMDDRTG